MFVITADQVSSRTTPDLVESTVENLNDQFRSAIALPADRTAGDELQLLVATAPEAFEVVLALTRADRWSVGCGVGGVNEPLPPGIRQAAGGAFIAARKAVDRAKKRPTRFALEHEHGLFGQDAADTEALTDLLLVLRSRRSEEGWELVDLVSQGHTQAEAAALLGITPQAASKRAQAAELRVEQAALDPLTRQWERLGSLAGGNNVGNNGGRP